MGKLKDWMIKQGLFDNENDNYTPDEMEIADMVIRSAFEAGSDEESHFFSANLNEAVWEVSTGLLGGNEVQVVIDGNDNLYWSVGNPGYVDFPAPPIGMKLPIKCWIHTHPFGSAYFSSTDWKTINTWRPYLQRAEVLGDNQIGVWQGEEGEVYRHYGITDDYNLVISVFGDDEE